MGLSGDGLDWLGIDSSFGEYDGGYEKNTLEGDDYWTKGDVYFLLSIILKNLIGDYDYDEFEESKGKVKKYSEKEIEDLGEKARVAVASLANEFGFDDLDIEYSISEIADDLDIEHSINDDEICFLKLFKEGREIYNLYTVFDRHYYAIPRIEIDINPFEFYSLNMTNKLISKCMPLYGERIVQWRLQKNE